VSRGSPSTSFQLGSSFSIGLTTPLFAHSLNIALLCHQVVDAVPEAITKNLPMEIPPQRQDKQPGTLWVGTSLLGAEQNSVHKDQGFISDLRGLGAISAATSVHAAVKPWSPQDTSGEMPTLVQQNCGAHFSFMLKPLVQTPPPTCRC
jgi:hypothetical protein